MKKILFSLFTILVLSSFQSVSAQDLLARQAPVDRKAKTIDTLSLHRILAAEELENPAGALYEDWDNTYAHRETALPEKFNIDLRGFCMPTVSRAVTSNFGARWGRAHKGIDLKVYVGDTIRAAFNGKVRIVRYEHKGYGKYIVIRHHNGLETIYGHLSKQLVEENQEVRAGDVIGLGGNTGRSTGSHLHFETRLCGVALNPALMFDFRAQDVVGDYYAFNRNTYQEESYEANRLRGVVGGGGYTREDVVGSATASTTNSAPVERASSFHKVKKGDNLYSIAKKRGISVSQLCRLNHITEKTKLRPGMILRYS